MLKRRFANPPDDTAASQLQIPGPVRSEELMDLSWTLGELAFGLKPVERDSETAAP